MSPLNNKSAAIAAWFAALGLFGTSTLGVVVAQAPEVVAPAATAPAPDAPAAPAATPISSPVAEGPPMVLLRTNGKVLQGEIRRDANGYVVKTKVGVMLFNRREVERTFRSMDELYAYKVSLCPEDDADERLKLATWCLEQKLKPEAKAQLGTVLRLSPDNRRAKAMLANLERPATTNPTLDEGLVRTSAEVPASMRPESDLERLRESHARNPRAASLPVIFNLEPALAVRRYQEFAANVHPILQNRCARCHNEATPGDFQLIQTRSRKDLSNDLVLRANLEATLRIVTSDDLSRSPILVASGMTHGNGGKPVLGGTASAEHKALAAWVTSLRSARAGESSAPSGRTAPTSSPGEGFAAGRQPSGSDPAMPPPLKGPKLLRTPPLSGVDMAAPETESPGVEPGFHPRMAPGTRPGDAEVVRPRIQPPGRIIPGSEAAVPGDAPDESEFVSVAEQQRRLARKLGGNATVNGSVAPNAAGKMATPGLLSATARKPAGQDSLADPDALVEGTPGTIKLPTGEIVRVVTKEMLDKRKIDPTKPSRIDLKKVKVINPKVDPPAK